MIHDKKALLDKLLSHFQLGVHSPHGPSHWGRVKTNGFEIAKHTDGVNFDVVELFALLHDSCRFNDYSDPEHGKRAVAVAETLRGEYFEITDKEFELLSYACEHHTSGLQEADITVQACWDADRLDLGRVGIIPSPNRLCTEYAKREDVIERALSRSQKGVL